MNIRVKLLLTIMVLVVITTYSQVQSPIGKWVLTEHIVSDIYDSINEYSTEKNVFNNEFEAFIIFDSCGNYYQQISDSAMYGKWKLSKGDRKLKVKIYNGPSHILKSISCFNFNKPLLFLESFSQYNHNIEYTTWGGVSKYVRVNSVIDHIDTNILLGKWEITHMQRGKHKQEYKSNWFFECKIDTISETHKYIGNWSVFGEEISDEIANREKWYPTQSKYYIEQVKNNTFVFVGIVGKKIELIYLERIR